MTLVKHGYPRDINYLFDEIFNSFPTSWGTDNHKATNYPKVNIHETKDAFLLELNAPGLNKEDIKVNAENGLLTISFEKKEEVENENVKTIKREFSYNSFSRSFSLDDKIDSEAIQAKYENGVLKLNLPKKEDIKTAPKTITIG